MKSVYAALLTAVTALGSGGSTNNKDFRADLLVTLKSVCGSQQAEHITSTQQNQQTLETLTKAISEQNLVGAACVIISQLEGHPEGDAGLLNSPIDAFGTTSIMYALRDYEPGDIDARKTIIMWLLAAGVDVNRINASLASSNTALSIAQERYTTPITTGLIWSFGGAGINADSRTGVLRNPLLVHKVCEHRLHVLSNSEPVLEEILLSRTSKFLMLGTVDRNETKLKLALDNTLKDRCPKDTTRDNLISGTDYGLELLKEVMAGNIGGVACRLQTILANEKKNPALKSLLLDSRWRGDIELRQDVKPIFVETVLAFGGGPKSSNPLEDFDSSRVVGTSLKQTYPLAGMSALDLAVAGLAWDMDHAAVVPTTVGAPMIIKGLSPYRAIVQMLLAAGVSVGGTPTSEQDALVTALLSDLDLTAAEIIGAGGTFVQDSNSGVVSRIIMSPSQKNKLLAATNQRLRVLRQSDLVMERKLLTVAIEDISKEAIRFATTVNKLKSKGEAKEPMSYLMTNTALTGASKEFSKFYGKSVSSAPARF